MKRTQDKKLVAKLQPHELKYICSVFEDDKWENLKIGVLRLVIKRLNSRSRRNIYVGLRAMGYVFVGKKSKKK